MLAASCRWIRKKYPITADDKDVAWEKRKADALEMGLKDFLEKWPIPTITVVGDWNPETPNLRLTSHEINDMLTSMVNSYRVEAGLHWHRIRNLKNGTVCHSTPEGLVEGVFQLFESNPDLPAVLIYSVEGFNMALALTTKDNRPIGVGTGPRQPGELTDAMVALVVGRPERVSGCVTTRNTPRSTITRSIPSSVAGAGVNHRLSSNPPNSSRNPGLSALLSNGMPCRFWPKFIAL